MLRSGDMVVMVMLMVLQVSSAQVSERLPICPLVRCLPGCVAVKGPNGCPIRCACPKTCQGMTCAIDEECILKTFFCFDIPCFPVPTCVKKQKPITLSTPCPLFICAPGCTPLRGPNGCLNRCNCPRTCANYKCAKYEVCVMRMDDCVGPFRCFPIPTCVPRFSMCLSNPRLRSCDLWCSNGFKTNANGCALCECNDDIA